MADEYCSICEERLVSMNTRTIGADRRFCVHCGDDLILPQVNKFVDELVVKYRTVNTPENMELKHRRLIGITYDPQAASKA